MKNQIFTLLAIVTFISCQNQRYTQNSLEIENSKNLIQDYNNKNWDALVGHYADTANIFFNTRVNSFKPDKLPNYHKSNDEDYASRGFISKDQEYEMVITDEGETWVNFWGTWECTLIDTNQEFELQIHITSQYINGKIVESHGYWDSAPIISALIDYTQSQKENEIIQITEIIDEQ